MQTISIDSLELHGDQLIPVIVQDAMSGKVLMMAWMNREALDLTLEKGQLVFWSRSRRELWHKGATSGNFMTLRELRADCDSDTLLAIVDPAGPACHTGEESCFFNRLYGEDEADIGVFLGHLWRFLQKRRDDPPEESYTARLLARGVKRVAQKVGEEGVETALACATGDVEEFKNEAADLLYHLMVACLASEVPFEDVIVTLKNRHSKKKQ